MAEESKLDFKRVLPLFVIVLIDLLGLTIIIPLLPLYAVTFEANALTIGILSAAYPVMQFLGAPVLGRLSDRYGRRPILIISQIGTLIGFIVLGLANGLWMLFIARIIDGISGANISTVQAAITDSTTEETRTQGLGLIGAAFGLGFIIGPIIAFGALAASGNNYSVPAFVAAGFSLASILLTTFWFKETHTGDRQSAKKSPFSMASLFDALKHPGVGILLVMMFVQQFAFGGLEYLLSLFTLSRLGMNASNNAALFVYLGLIIVAVQGYFIGRWSRRFGERRLIFATMALLAVGMFLTALTPRKPPATYSRERLEAELQAESAGETEIRIELPDDDNTGWLGLGWLLVAMIPAAIGGGALQPAINSLITKRVSAAEVGGMLGISTSMFSGANAITPVVNAALFQEFGPSAPFVTGGVVLVVLLIVALRVLTPGAEADTAAGLSRGRAAH